MKYCSLVLALLACVYTTSVNAVITLQKAVAPEVASAGELVEFTITVSNDGTDPVTDVHVTELLPAGLDGPSGTAPFVSQGTYDAVSGDWAVGEIAAGADAVMSIPAQVLADPSPCIVNEARVEPSATDPDRATPSAAAAVRQPGVEACVDLQIDSVNFSVPDPFCSDVTNATLFFTVRNAGLDQARAVTVAASQTPALIPDFGFLSSACTDTDPLACTIGNLEPGAIRLLSIRSSQFNNANAYTVALQLDVDTQDVDYDLGSNQFSLQGQVPATVVTDCPIPAPPQAGAPSCFIATAAWGEPWDDEVMTLRMFREQYLLTNAPGQAFVSWYYRMSPPFANYIADRPRLRRVVRGSLTPVVHSIRHPRAALATIATLFMVIVFRRRIRLRLARALG